VADQAKDFSGFAMWTKVVVDDKEEEIDVRKQKTSSHWAYVVALMAEKPVNVVAPGPIELRGTIDYTASPVSYTLETTVPIAA